MLISWSARASKKRLRNRSQFFAIHQHFLSSQAGTFSQDFSLASWKEHKWDSLKCVPSWCHHVVLPSQYVPSNANKSKFRSPQFLSKEEVYTSELRIANGCHSNGCLLVVQKKSCKTWFTLKFHCPKIGPFPACPATSPAPNGQSPGAGPFDCQEPQILGQSCRAPCDSGADFAVITCEEQGWTLQDECPTESYLLDAGIYLGL